MQVRAAKDKLEYRFHGSAFEGWNFLFREVFRSQSFVLELESSVLSSLGLAF